MDGPHMETLRDTLCELFTKDELTELVKFRLNRDLAQIVKTDATYEKVVFELIARGTREGWLGDLILAASEKRPGNLALWSFRNEEVLARKMGHVERKLDDLKKLQLELAFQMNRDLLVMRYKAYGRLWSRTKATMVYTAEAFGPEKVLDFKEALSDWYFSDDGGIFLTVKARDFYFALQDLVHAVCGLGGWTCDPRPTNPRQLFVELVEPLDVDDELKRRLREGLKDKTGVNREWYATINTADWAACCEKVSGRLKALVGGADPRAGAMVYAAIQQVASVLRTILVHELGSREDVERPAAR